MSDLEYMIINNVLLVFKCIGCNKIYEDEFDEDLAKRFPNTCKFCDRNLNKLCLMSQKYVYPYEYMNSWQRFNEKSILDKKEFCSNLTMENMTDADYKHRKRVWKGLGRKKPRRAP